MALPTYLTITGERQGLISAGACGKASLGNAWLPEHEDQIQILEVHHDVRGASDTASGYREHGPLTIIKPMDKSSPLLQNAWATGENLPYCRLDFYRISATGQRERYYCIELEEACITAFNTGFPHSQDVANQHRGPTETVSISYRKITWTHVAGTMASDRWRETLSRDTPPLLRPEPWPHLQKPEPERRLESTFAIDQLTRIAKGCTPAEFVMLLTPVFGYDIPAKAYLELRQKLIEGTVANPGYEIVDSRTPLGSYDNDTQTIRVTHDTIKRAINNRESAWTLLTLLLHEFGHHIDHILRVDLARRDLRKTPPGFTDDAPGDEGARFAYRMALFDLKESLATPYATY